MTKRLTLFEHESQTGKAKVTAANLLRVMLAIRSDKVKVQTGQGFPI